MYKYISIIALSAFALTSNVFAGEGISRGEMIAVTCAGCHGTDGAGGTAIPTLKGRDGGQMLKLMLDYKNDTLPGTVMPRIAKGYTDEELKAVTEYFASMKAEDEAKDDPAKDE